MQLLNQLWQQERELLVENKTGKKLNVGCNVIAPRNKINFAREAVTHQ